MPFKFEGKGMYPIFVFAKIWSIVFAKIWSKIWSILQKFGQFTAWQECSQQTKKNHFHTNSAVSC